MLRNSKVLIIGILIGIILASTAAFGADVIRDSYFNSDLKLAINGKPIQDLRIVTVELEGEQYGRNYYSIADLVKALNDFGGVVAKVDFDANTKTTVIDIEQKTVYITPIPEQSLQVGGDENTVTTINQNWEKTPDGLIIWKHDGGKHISMGDIKFKLKENNYSLVYTDTGVVLIKPDLSIKNRDPRTVYDTDEIIINDVQMITIDRDGSKSITPEYYIENIMPLVYKGAE